MANIQKELHAINQSGAPYKLSISIGYSYGKYASMKDIESLLRGTDSAMYAENAKVYGAR